MPLSSVCVEPTLETAVSGPTMSTFQALEAQGIKIPLNKDNVMFHFGAECKITINLNK
jgi:hypothetical protein